MYGTSYTMKYIEHHIQTNTWDIICKKMYGTSYTNKYMEHHIEIYT